jgi:sec-independent protein translocase protein TatC
MASLATVRNRKYAILVAFIIGAFLTPPDVFSQTALAVPFIILYEVGIVVARLFGKKKAADPEAEEAAS